MEKVLILDFGSQYTMLIARRVREVNVYCEIHPYNMSIEEIKTFNPRAIILSGGPASVTAADAYNCDPEVFELGVPILGICYGLQLMAKMLGGEVEASDHREYGAANLVVDNDADLFAGCSDQDGIQSANLHHEGQVANGLRVWMSHGDRIKSIPPGFEIIGHTVNSAVAAMRDKSRGFFAVQFHPEVAHTPQGKNILANFLFKIAGCSGDWSMKNFIDQAVESIRNQVGNNNVILGLSGGVDSSVAAMLMHLAVGPQLTCIYVDNGLMRLNESESVARLFREKFRIKLRAIDASHHFLSELAGVTDPEKKRKVIGRVFIEIFEKEAKQIPGVKFLGQGTLYPDVIESVSFKGPSATIKSHHNVGGLPEKMDLELVEPLRELFKDEVREVGKELGMPEEVIWRQPFPGPGLGIRILGKITKDRLAILQKADAIVTSEIDAWDSKREVWQYFAVLLPVRSVGVMGDERTYDYTIAVRAVKSVDGMTADYADLPHSLLSKISNRIINEVRGVNRVVYDISSKPPATVEWE